MPRLPVCKGKKAVKAFKEDGWFLARYIDDHFILKKQGERSLKLEGLSDWSARLEDYLSKECS